MRAAFIGLALILLTAQTAFSQEGDEVETANLDPAPAELALSDVIASCQAGVCVADTESFLQAHADDEDESALIELVNQLALIAQTDEACNDLDVNISDAIYLAATYSDSADQQAFITGVGDTVADCDQTATAAIGDGITVPSDG
jgi:hypothetical protein